MDATRFDQALSAALSQVADLRTAELVNFPLGRPVTPEDDQAWATQCLQLLNRWDHQQWSVVTIDFSGDKQEWLQMGDGSVRNMLARVLGMFFVGDVAVTRDLAPLIFATSNREEQLLLAAQMGDEARHAMFFRRFLHEVTGLDGDFSAMVTAVDLEAGLGFRNTFARLAAAVALVHAQPQDAGGWVAAVTLYHIVIESYLAIGRQNRLLTFLTDHGILPIFTDGLRNVTRDEVRHSMAGTLFLQRRVRDNPDMVRVIAEEALVSGYMLAASRSTDFSRSESPESRSTAQRHLRHSLQKIGLSDTVIEIVEVPFK